MICAFCFDDFNPDHGRQKYCSEICREEYLAGSRRIKHYDYQQPTRICKCCKEIFIVGNPREEFCDKQCRQSFFEWLYKENGMSSEKQKRWRKKNPCKVREMSTKYSSKRYQDMKLDGEKYEQWRSTMDSYSDPNRKRASQRRRKSNTALSTLLIPTTSIQEE